MERFREILQDCHKSCSILLNSSENKHKIVSQRKADIDELGKKFGWQEDTRFQRMRWEDLRITSKWIAGHHGRGATGKNWKMGAISHVRHIYYMAYGEDYDIEVPERFNKITTFTQEPCVDCKKLESQYKEDDSQLSVGTKLWSVQYYNILQALIMDGYISWGAANYFDSEIEKIRHKLVGNSPAGHPWEKIISSWKLMMEKGRLIFYQGRGCFYQTDASAYSQFNDVPKEQRDDVLFDMAMKYINTGDNPLKCSSGIYVLDENKLCVRCKAKVEPYPLEATKRGAIPKQPVHTVL